MRALSLRAACMALLILVAAPLHAQQSTPQSTAAADNAISQLRSPYCPGLMLEVCPSPQAALLRDSIHALAARGHGADALVEWMLAGYGEEWRALPEKKGTGLWAWLIPPAALLLGAVLVWATLRRMRRERPPVIIPADGISEADRARLDDALGAWEREAAT